MKALLFRWCNKYVLAQRKPKVALLLAKCTPDSAPEAGELMWLMSQVKATPSCCPYCAGGPFGQNSTPPGTLSRHLSVTCVLHHGIRAADLCLPRLPNCECPLELVKHEDLCLQLKSGGRSVSGAPRTSTQRCVAIDASWSCCPALLTT